MIKYIRQANAKQQFLRLFLSAGLLVCYISGLFFVSVCLGSDLPGMGNVSLNQATEILARKFVKKRVVITGGNYSAPYVISDSFTEYLLEGDIVAEGTAIAIRAPKVILDLNGKTIIYNQTRAGEGVTIDAYHTNDIAIINGNIRQGLAQSEGDVYGNGNNPIKSIGVSRVQISGINASYGGRDVNGFSLKYVGEGIVENCRLEDHWKIGIPKNRHQGKNAVGIGDRAVVRNNTIVNARQNGIGAGNNSEIYSNEISINSMSTNSAGILGYKAKHIKVHHNIIVGRGEHPLGISFVSAGTDNIEIYNNSIDVQTTKLGDEYASAGGNYAVGFRTTWGGNNIRFHDNTIIVRTDSAFNGTRSSTGKAVTVNGKGRGLMVAVNAQEKAWFYNNKITVLDKDGSGEAYGIACTGNNVGEMTFEENIVTSNILNVALGDEYGACDGYPLFLRNTFVKTDNYPAYRTVASELEGYYKGTGRFVSNRYIEGASQDSINIHAESKAVKSVWFGREFSAELIMPDSRLVANVAITVDNPDSLFNSIFRTDEAGKTRLIVYDYELHNRNDKVGQKRLLSQHVFNAVVGGDQQIIRSGTLPEGWEKLKTTGEYELPLYYETSGEWAGTLKVFNAIDKAM